jgi:hypothetical protein
MASTPAPIQVPPVVAPMQHWVTTWGSFIKAHEKLLIIILASFLLFRAGQGIENIILKHDSKVATQAATVVKTDEVSNKALADQLSQMKSDAAKQTAILNNQISSLQSALVKQKAKDAISTPTEIDSRWQELLPLKPGSITSIDQSTTGVTNEAANQTVQALEEIPVLKVQVANLTTELGTDQKIIIQQDNTITGLNTQIVDEKSSHVADVKLEKDKAKKSFWKGFKVGLIVGAVGVEAVRIWAGRP